MVRKINYRLYKVNTYVSAHIIEVDDDYDEEVQKLRKEIQLDSIGYKLNLLVYLATLTVQGYAILSVTEFNIDGSKPRVAYASNKDFKKIVKYYLEKKVYETAIWIGMIKMKYLKTENVLDEIDWGNGRKFKCNSYWNDDTSFALDIGDGELTDKEGNPYFIHCEYNCNNGMWHYVFEIWFENDTCSIYDIPEPDRSEYLSETEIEELRGIIYNMCKDEINL